MDQNIWFQLETRVRVLIKDLIEPTVRRVAETVKSVDQLSNNQQSILYKFEDVEMMVENLEKRLVVIDEFTSKMVEFEGNVNVIESRIKQDREELRSDLMSFAKNQVAFEEKLEVLQRQREDIKEEMSSMNSLILSHKFDLDGKITTASQQFKDAVFAFNSNFAKINSAADQVNKELAEVFKKVAEIEVKNSEALRGMEDNKSDIKKIKGKIEKMNNLISKEIDKVRNLALINQSEILTNRKEIKRIDQLIEEDNRTDWVELRITEPLYSVFSDLTALKALAEFEIKRLDRFAPTRSPESVKEEILKIRAKAKEIIDRPFPIVKKESNITTHSKKKRRKEKLKSFKQKMALSIKNTFKNKTNESGQQILKSSIGKVIEKHVSSNKISDQLIEAPVRKRSIDRRQSSLDISEELKGSFDNSLNDISKRKSREKLSQSRHSQRPNPAPRQKSSDKHFPEILKKSSIVSISSKNEESLVDPTLNERKFSTVIHDAMVSSLMPSDDESDSGSSDLFIDFTPMIENVKIQLQQESQEMHLELTQKIELVSTSLVKNITEVKSELQATILSIKSKHEDYTSVMDKRIKEIELLIQQAVYECNAASAQRKRDHVDYANQFRFIKNGFDEISNSQKELSDRIDAVNKSVDGLFEFGKISIAMQGQDENDRESIFLMGSKVAKKNKVVSIDKRCLSCTGQSSAVISAFKIACLAYEPSLVNFQDKKLTRKKLLQLQMKILDSYASGNLLDLSDELREVEKNANTSGHWRPLSVPVSRFSTLTSPHLMRTPDVDNLPVLRKSINL